MDVSQARDGLRLEDAGSSTRRLLLTVESDLMPA